MPAKSSGDKPPKVSLNLDTLEREDAPEPFSFVLDGKPWTAIDPAVIDWKDLVDLDVRDTREVVRLYLGPAFEEFEKLSLPMWKLDRLAGDLVKAYGLVNLGELGAS